MTRLSIIAISLLLISGHQVAFATQEEFCAGFSEGYKTIRGDMVLVPLCPLAPLTPLGTTDFRQGLLAGIRAAQR